MTEEKNDMFSGGSEVPDNKKLLEYLNGSLSDAERDHLLLCQRWRLLRLGTRGRRIEQDQTILQDLMAPGSGDARIRHSADVTGTVTGVISSGPRPGLDKPPYA